MTDQMDILKVVECVNDRTEGALNEVKAVSIRQAVSETKIHGLTDDLETVRATVLDVHGDVSVLKEGYRKLEDESDLSRKKHHDSSGYIQQHQGKLELMENNYNTIRKEVGEVKESMTTLTKLIKWGFILIMAAITSGVDLKPVIKELLSYL